MMPKITKPIELIEYAIKANQVQLISLIYK